MTDHAAATRAVLAGPWEGHIVDCGGFILDGQADQPDVGKVFPAVCRPDMIHTLEDADVDADGNPVALPAIDVLPVSGRIYLDHSSDDWGGSAPATLAVARAIAAGLNAAAAQGATT